MEIQIIGCLGFTPWKSKLARKFTSSRWFWDDRSLQIDIGNKYEGKPVNFLLITHTHYDHVGEFKSCPRETEVLVPSGTFIEPLRKKNNMVNFRLVKAKTSLDGLSIKPFPVLHSATTLTYGWKFFLKDKIFVWLPDYCIIPAFSDVLENLDILFLGASALKKPIMHRGYGYCQTAVYQVLEKISRLRKPPRLIILMHFGMGMSPIIRKTKYLQKEFSKLSIHYSWDGKRIWYEDNKIKWSSPKTY